MSATDDEARRVYLISMREKLSFTQSKMAMALGMSLRSYSDLETAERSCRVIHILAAERVLLREAVERRDRGVLTGPVAKDIAALPEVEPPAKPLGRIVFKKKII